MGILLMVMGVVNSVLLKKDTHAKDNLLQLIYVLIFAHPTPPLK